MNKKTEVVRLVVLAAALFNQILVLSGKNTLPFTEAEMTEAVTVLFTAGTSFWVWWKSNFRRKTKDYFHKYWK